MSAFPVLKTGAVAQYPLERSVRFPVQAVRFLNGSQQIYQLSAGGLRRWAIRLELLDEAEVAALIRFSEAQQGSEFGRSTQDVFRELHLNCGRLDRPSLNRLFPVEESESVPSQLGHYLRRSARHE